MTPFQEVLCMYPFIKFRPLLLIFNLTLLCQVIAQAPGDGDSFCTQQSSVIVPPAYPPNIGPLMDSYHYLRLLSPVSSYPSAWQQVDVDATPDSNGGASEVRIDHIYNN